jgi:hypothetical protein
LRFAAVLLQPLFLGSDVSVLQHCHILLSDIRGSNTHDADANRRLAYMHGVLPQPNGSPSSLHKLRKVRPGFYREVF